jgi:hypothetical protein
MIGQRYGHLIPEFAEAEVDNMHAALGNFRRAEGTSSVESVRLGSEPVDSRCGVPTEAVRHLASSLSAT